MDKKFEEDAAMLRTLVARYKANRAKVPLQMLRTRYAVAYHKLRMDMLEVAFRMAYQVPDWMWGIGPPIEAWELMLAVFRHSLCKGGHKKELKRALFSDRDADEAVRVARQMSREAIAAWDAYLDETSIHLAEVEEDGSSRLSDLRRYNPILRAVEENGSWRKLREGEAAPDCRREVEAELARWREWMPGEGK